MLHKSVTKVANSIFLTSETLSLIIRGALKVSGLNVVQNFKEEMLALLVARYVTYTTDAPKP